MPIRFRCPQCGQKLSVTERKAGRQGICPKCARPLLIPAAEPPAESGGSAAGELAAPVSTASSAVPPPAPAVSDQWIYMDDDPVQGDPPVRDDRVVVPRRVIYLQGFLLPAVGLICFLLGHSRASRTLRDQPGSTHRQGPAAVTGAVSFQSTHGRPLPDGNSAVIVVPAARRPDSHDRPDVAGLPPEDPPPRPGNEALRVIQLLGGAYGRTNGEGTYRLELPESGTYFMLVLSGHAQREAGGELDKADLAQIGRYFLPATELLRERKYTWQRLEIDGLTRFDVAF